MCVAHAVIPQPRYSGLIIFYFKGSDFRFRTGHEDILFRNRQVARRIGCTAK